MGVCVASPPPEPGWPEEEGGRRTEGAGALLTPLPPPFWRGLSRGLREGRSPTYSPASLRRWQACGLVAARPLWFRSWLCSHLFCDLEQMVYI